ncbi:MAG: bifunctional DNA-formamidopyrimidine glycosylase/DNA-(apurinic or apyrimidinic site) lyase [Acetobacter sp.]|nr:bifunctional DNA-formamidopyrimidine glycosylase/DNA-(apurinic or apyrimidinic site) lyase [Acetobacter sp.]
MPELPEVETIKEALKQAIDGATVLDITIKNRYFREIIPIDFENKIINAQICKVYRFAKYIIIELNNGLSIIWHLGMSGRVKICDILPNELDKHDHIVFKTNKGYVIYNDARRFGLMTYTRTTSLKDHHLFHHIGIDPFNESLTVSYLWEHLKNKKIPIKTALLDQSIINGIGNIYASEALYEARISPLRSCCDISLTEINLLIIAIRQTLQKAILAGGSTLRDYRRPDGSMGYFQHQHCVYNKTGQRCPDCTCNIEKTGGIKRIIQCGRSTFYCERKQK